MKRKILWLIISGLMVLSLVIAACGPAATPTSPTTPTTSTPTATPTAPSSPTAPANPVETPIQKEATSSDTPKYGGWLIISDTNERADFDPYQNTAASQNAVNLVCQGLWEGDWSKGPAGGYGTNETDWLESYDIFDHKQGLIAESTTWTIDEEKQEGTVVYKVRQGIHWGLNPELEDSRMVGGRELTADDVLFSVKWAITNPLSYIYKSQPELRGSVVTKTGPWEVTAKVPLEGLLSFISRLGDSHNLVPPEIIEKYGNASDWRRLIGTDAFMLADYVPGSAITVIRNPNFWGKDPVGPGKGNQLPYLDGVRVLTIPDRSTQLAALRTAKIDQMDGINLEEYYMMKKTAPKLLEAQNQLTGTAKAFMRTDLPPFNDVRVRRAMMMATDFNTILQGWYDGLGDINTFPHKYSKAYDALYLALDAPDTPESVKELYVYNPEKAKKLLTEAGYPNGFQTSIVLQSTEVDYYSIIKDMWAKVGIDLFLDVKEKGVHDTIGTARSYEALSTTGGQAPTSIFYLATSIAGNSRANGSMVNDPFINEELVKIRRVALDDIYEAMGMYRELAKYIMDQAFAIPGVNGYNYTLWWPWVRNYTGEYDVGYFNFIGWSQWVWFDNNMKKSMGY